MKTILVLSFTAVSLNLTAAPPAWPQFRGPNSSGVAEKSKPPLAFGPKSNLLWKTEAPPGLSSPCIAGDHIFITAFVDGKQVALGYDRRDGKELWRQPAPEGKPQEVHKVSSPAVATPATDGQRVIVYYTGFGLVAYDFKGREQWRKALPAGYVMNGSGTSPAIVGDTLVLNCDQDEGESFLLAVEARSGKTRWQTPRKEVASSYTTPILWKRNGRSDVVVAGSMRVAGYDLRDGKEQWTSRVMTSVSVAPTPVAAGDRLFVMSRGVPPTAMGTFASFFGKMDENSDGKIALTEVPREMKGGMFRKMDNDSDGFITEKDWSAMTNLFAQGDSGLFALQASGTKNSSGMQTLWKKTKGVSAITSPLLYDGRLYVVQDGGRLTCWNAGDGTVLYEQERLNAEGEYYASPVAANGHVYLASIRGVINAVRAGDKLEIAGRSELGESVMTTPAIADDKVYVRSEGHLWAFGRSTRKLALNTSR